MTGDDEARLRMPFRGAAEPPHESQLTPQPRPNVLFEAGLALGLHPDRVVFVQVGHLRPLSDLAGRHYLRFEDNSTFRSELRQRLITAGCEVKETGDSWLKAGNLQQVAADSAIADEVSVAPATDTLRRHKGIWWGQSGKGFYPYCRLCWDDHREWICLARIDPGGPFAVYQCSRQHRPVTIRESEVPSMSQR